MKHFNQKLLLENINNNEEFLKEIIEMSSKSLIEFKEILENYNLKRDSGKIKEIIHSIKGMALNMYFEKLSMLAIDFEKNDIEREESIKIENDIKKIIEEIDFLIDNTAINN